MCCGIREGSTAAVDKVNLDSIDFGRFSYFQQFRRKIKQLQSS